jgi:hypothetical protein
MSSRQIIAAGRGDWGGESNYIIGILGDFGVQLADFFCFGDYFYSRIDFLRSKGRHPTKLFLKGTARPQIQ